MYKVAYISGNPGNIGEILHKLVNDINKVNGKIAHIVQSQSTNNFGQAIVTVTIIYIAD